MHCLDCPEAEPLGKHSGSENTPGRKTLRRWRSEIPAHHQTGVSNGPTEAVNLTIKAVKCRRRGFRNFSNYRLHLLLDASVTWHTHRTTRIRGRHPRLITVGPVKAH